MYGLSADDSIRHKYLPKFSQHVFPRVDTVFGHAHVKTSKWPFFDRQSTEFIGASALVRVPSTAPRCPANTCLSRALGLRRRPRVKQADAWHRGTRTHAPRCILESNCNTRTCAFSSLEAAKKNSWSFQKISVAKHVSPYFGCAWHRATDSPSFCDVHNLPFILHVQSTDFMSRILSVHRLTW